MGNETTNWEMHHRWRVAWRSPLRLRQLRVLLCLLDHADHQTGRARPCSKRVARLLDISPAHVRTEIRSLVSSDMLPRRWRRCWTELG